MYSSKSMNSCSVIASSPDALYAASSWRMSSTFVTFFQPPPSAGFKIAGNLM